MLKHIRQPPSPFGAQSIKMSEIYNTQYQSGKYYREVEPSPHENNRVPRWLVYRSFRLCRIGLFNRNLSLYLYLYLNLQGCTLLCQIIGMEPALNACNPRPPSENATNKRWCNISPVPDFRDRKCGQLDAESLRVGGKCCLYHLQAFCQVTGRYCLFDVKTYH